MVHILAKMKSLKKLRKALLYLIPLKYRELRNAEISATGCMVLAKSLSFPGPERTGLEEGPSRPGAVRTRPREERLMLSLCPHLPPHLLALRRGPAPRQALVRPQAAAPVYPRSRHQFPLGEMGVSNCERVKVSGLPAVRSYYLLTSASPPQAKLEVSP